MLTQLREKSQSFIIYILFGILTFVFIFFFGPQSEGCRPGAQVVVRTGWAAEVNGQTITQEEVESYMRRQIGYGSADPDDLDLGRTRRETLLQMIDQVLIVQRAEALGIAVSEDELSRYIVGRETNPDFVFFADRQGNFDYDRFKDEVGQRFGMSIRQYRTLKERELLVSKYLDFLADQIKIAEREVRRVFDDAERKWNLAYIAVDSESLPGDAAEIAKPSEAEGADFAKKNAEAVKAFYEKNKATYNREKEIRVRRVLVRIPKDAPDADAARAEARKKIDALHAKAAAEGADLAAIAQEGSEGYYKDKGGDMGWQRRGNSSEASWKVYDALEQGQLSEVHELGPGFAFFRAEQIKPAVQKTLEQAQAEIGQLLAWNERRMAAARKVAARLLEKAKGGTSFDELVARANDLQPESPEPAPDDAAEKPGADEPAKVARPELPQGTQLTVQKTGEFNALRPSWNRIPGVGESPELVAALDGLTMEEPLLPKLIEADGKVFLVRLHARVEPDDAAFASQRSDLETRMRQARQAQLMGYWKQSLFGSARQHALNKRLRGGALFASLPDPTQSAEIELNDEAFPVVVQPATALN